MCVVIGILFTMHYCVFTKLIAAYADTYGSTRFLITLQGI